MKLSDSPSGAHSSIQDLSEPWMKNLMFLRNLSAWAGTKMLGKSASVSMSWEGEVVC